MATPSKVQRTDMDRNEPTDVKGYIHNVSPLKSSAKSNLHYFNCIIQSDRSTFSEVVSFSPEQRTQFIQAADRKTPVQMKNCTRKLDFASPSGCKYLVTRTSSVDIVENLSFASKQPPATTTCEISISEGLMKTIGSYVTVKGKVTSVDEGMEKKTTKSGKRINLRNAIIADHSGGCRVSLWDTHAEGITQDHSYRFANVSVKEFDSETFLSTTPRSDIIMIDDLIDVKYLPKEETQFSGKPTLVSVSQMLSCKNCQHKIDQTLNTPTFKCAICKMRQVIDDESKLMTMKIKLQDIEKMFMVHNNVARAFLNENDINSKDSDDIEELLFTKTLKLHVTSPTATTVNKMTLTSNVL